MSRWIRGWRLMAAWLLICLFSSLGHGQRLPVLVGRTPDAAESAGKDQTAWSDGAGGERSGNETSESGLALTLDSYQEKVAPRNAPAIPEPMLFDLMRPLGAERGELEVNALVRPSIGRRGQGVAWAPEIEFAFAPGHTLEIEFPFEGGHLEAFKFGLQGTLGAFRQNRSIHGWQALVERARAGNGLQIDALHLAGHRIGQRWSVFTMQGLRWQRDERRKAVKGVFNPTVFRDFSERLTLGLETNLALGARGRADWAVLPQAHVEWRRYSFQLGFGAERNLATGTARPALAIRLVRVIGSAGH